MCVWEGRGTGVCDCDGVCAVCVCVRLCVCACVCSAECSCSVHYVACVVCVMFLRRDTQQKLVFLGGGVWGWGGVIAANAKTHQSSNGQHRIHFMKKTDALAKPVSFCQWFRKTTALEQSAANACVRIMKHQGRPLVLFSRSDKVTSFGHHR